MINNLNIFKALVLLIFGINNIFCQSAEEILKKAQEKSLVLTDSYYKFKIESKLDNPILPITGELFTRGEKYIKNLPIVKISKPFPASSSIYNQKV